MRAALDAVPVLVLSHCWERPEHPDPEARTLSALAVVLAGTWGEWGSNTVPRGGLPLYRAWGLADVGVFVDWASLYQKPRSDAQAACFGRALDNMSLWYAHRLTTVLLVWGQDAHLHVPRTDRGWPYYEQAASPAPPAPALPS